MSLAVVVPSSRQALLLAVPNLMFEDKTEATNSCRQRRDRSPNNDVWDLRHRWDDLKPALQRQLLAGRYRFSPVDVVQLETGERVESWCASDALVLKALSIVLGDTLRPQLSSRCFHLRGNGGSKGAVREVCAALGTGTHHHVFRTYF